MGINGKDGAQLFGKGRIKVKLCYVVAVKFVDVV